MNTLMGKYVRSKFIAFFFFCILSVILIFVVVDMVENMDQFIDKNVPWRIVVLYYLYYIPYMLVLTIPMATLMAAVFSVGILARHNEIIAMKSLGYSIYRLLGVLLKMGAIIALSSFVLAEVVTARSNQRKMDIERMYLGIVPEERAGQMRNLQIQEPPDKIITIGIYNTDRKIAQNVNIYSFEGSRLLSRIDAASMVWNGTSWVLQGAYKRQFSGDREEAQSHVEPMELHFQFGPDELVASNIKPDEMDFFQLHRFIRRIERSGGEVFQWITDLHLRIAYPASNIIIVLLSLPLVYNRRKKSLVSGFGFSLAICFIYFGLIKVGETMGHNGSLYPFFAAWMGNGIMGIVGGIDLIKTRK